ncbi:hypothetical protein VN12_14280 [Pirellula sp. SH-Sr6A]|nr:hypothetical protein VN12_14280 [Pirellula sp. SH-Sr6A]
MHTLNATNPTSQVLRSPSPRTGKPNATLGCTEVTNAAWPSFDVHSINASVSPSLVEATSSTWHYQGNQQFSITAVTTSSGSVAERYGNTSNGQPVFLDVSGSPLTPQSSTLRNRYTYTEREWDATLRLCHFHATRMSGLAGRVRGRDPIRIRCLPSAIAYCRLLELSANESFFLPMDR